MPSATALRSSVAVGALLGVAVFTASPASAQGYYWREMEPGYYYPQRQVIHPPRPTRARRAASKKEVIKDTAVHPQMPLIINVSIARQRVTVYDANGQFAEAPVSTGMAGHPTPMGVFSVIQKDRYHHSNIYSGAPMPFMQRITWGGIALHAGVLPGYPASHGCIRMPESFAIKMWGWTKMGARVIVTPGELSPSTFTHPLLPTMKVAPQPVVAEQSETNDPVGAKADKGAPEMKPIEAKLELRSTVGHSDNIKPVTDEALIPDTPSANATATKVDGAPQGSTVTVGTDRSSDAAKPDADTAAKSAEVANTTKSEEIKSDAKADTAKPDAAAVDAPAATPKPDAAKTDAPKAGDTAKTDSAKTDSAKPDAAPVKAPSDAVAPTPDAKKDQTRLGNTDKPPKPDGKRRDGQLAVFISRKDSKLYVRQNFAPLFDIPVTIAASDRPLGTHLFTATVDKIDSNILHWSVVTVPMSARAAMRASDDPRASRRHKGKPIVEAKPAPLPDSPAEALDRITIPADTMARISEALTSGGSIIVSDQGINQGETGEYTDFIIRTH